MSLCSIRICAFAQALKKWASYKVPRVWFLRTDLVFYAAFISQIFFWSNTRSLRPEMVVVPPPPSPIAVKALSLGDEQFYFRALAFELQNLGDTFGRFTPLKDYDFKRLSKWWEVLDELDPRSHFVPSIASYYYSQTQNEPDVRYVVDYLDKHSSKDLSRNWWWMGQAVYLANYKLKDKKLALELAYKLAQTPRDDVPIWVKQMPAFILEQMGEEEQALIIIKDIIARSENLDPGEFNFMRYFVKDRLDKFLAGLTDKPVRSLEAQKPKTHGGVELYDSPKPPIVDQIIRKLTPAAPAKAPSANP